MKIETFFMIKSTVAIQGIKGSFHHIVSQQFFDETMSVSECLTFDTVVDRILKRKTMQLLWLLKILLQVLLFLIMP